MSDKLSPKDFASITEWAKQYIVGNIKGELLDPVIAVKSNTHTELIYTVNNPNEVDAYFNDELISAKGQSEMTHIWSEDKLTISGALKAKNYKSSNVVSLEVERAPDTVPVTIQITQYIYSPGYMRYLNFGLKFSDNITVSSITPKSGSVSLYTTRNQQYYESYYMTGETTTTNAKTSSIGCTDNKCDEVFTRLVVSDYEEGEGYYLRRWYGYNTNQGMSPSFKAVNEFICSLNFDITYIYNGNTITKNVDLSLKKDIASINGKTMATNNIFDDLNVSTTINI